MESVLLIGKMKLLLQQCLGGIKLLGKSCFVVLTKERLIFIDCKSTKKVWKEYSVFDIVGACPQKSGNKKGRSVAHVFLYPVQKGCCGSEKKPKERFRLQLNIEFHLDGSSAVCQNWINAFNSVGTNIFDFAREEDGTTIVAPPKRKYILFVNPASGTGIVICDVCNFYNQIMCMSDFEDYQNVTERKKTTGIYSSSQQYSLFCHYNIHCSVIAMNFMLSFVCES